MTNNWQHIIDQQSTLNEHQDVGVEPCFIPLSQLGVLQVAGEDAQKFLQNLVTNDVNAIAINQSQLNGLCTAKGRLFALFLLIRRHDSFQLILPSSMCAILQQRLSIYILHLKVTISDISEQLVCFGITNIINSLELASDLYHATENNNVLFINYSDSNPYFLCLAEPQHAVELIQKLQQQHWHLAGNNQWQQLEIEQGLPAIYPESKEKFTPQQVNLDLIGGVSFTKGCYPGQEVVARLHYLGKPSRRMFVAQAQTNELPTAGEQVTNDKGDVAGHVVRAQVKDANTIQLLLSLKLSDKRSTIFVNSTTAITVRPQPLIN